MVWKMMIETSCSKKLVDSSSDILIILPISIQDIRPINRIVR